MQQAVEYPLRVSNLEYRFRSFSCPPNRQLSIKNRKSRFTFLLSNPRKRACFSQQALQVI